MSLTFVTRVKVFFINSFFHIVTICRSIIENPTFLSNGMLLGALIIVTMLLAREVGHLYAPQKFGAKLGIPYLVPN
jgi:hypothetical protein